jgi:hypothetical protein
MTSPVSTYKIPGLSRYPARDNWMLHPQGTSPTLSTNIICSAARAELHAGLSISSAS